MPGPKASIAFSVAVIPEGLDPADYVTGKGADALRAIVDAARPLLEFSIDRRLARWDLEQPEERARALKDAAEVLAPVKDSLLADDYANYIADRLLADFSTVRRAIAAARPSAGSQAYSETAPTDGSNEPIALTPRIAAERDLLGLLLVHPDLRCKARELLASGLLSTAEHKAIAEVLAEADTTISAKEMQGLLEQRAPGASALLSGARLSEGGADHAILAQGLERRLKEFELERRIAVGKARLKSPGTFKTPAEYDDQFREVSALQRTLDAVRRGQDAGIDQLEAQD